MPEEAITKCKCLKCGYEWWPRSPKVYQCANPKCKTVHWNDYTPPPMVEHYIIEDLPKVSTDTEDTRP